jgi:hypothetical protein
VLEQQQTVATAVFNSEINKVNAKMTWNTTAWDGTNLEIKVYQKSLKAIAKDNTNTVPAVGMMARSHGQQQQSREKSSYRMAGKLFVSSCLLWIKLYQSWTQEEVREIGTVKDVAVLKHKWDG